jgi:hypothetical protein
MIASRYDNTRAKFDLPWEVSFSIGACVGFIVGWLGFIWISVVVGGILKAISFVSGTRMEVLTNYQWHLFAIIILIYFATVWMVGIKLFNQYFVSGLLLALPAFFLFLSLSAEIHFSHRLI